MTHVQPAVIIGSAVAAQLESILSPGDECYAIDELHAKLPLLHKPRRRRRPAWIPKNLTPIYRGRFKNIPLGFDYVRVDGAFQVLRFWDDYGDEPDRDFDCRLGQTAD